MNKIEILKKEIELNLKRINFHYKRAKKLLENNNYNGLYYSYYAQYKEEKRILEHLLEIINKEY